MAHINLWYPVLEGCVALCSGKVLQILSGTGSVSILRIQGFFHLDCFLGV